MAFSYITSCRRERKQAIAEMVRRRQEGQTFYTIARAYGIAHSTCHRLVSDELHRQGIKLQPYSRPHTSEHPFFDH